MSRPSDKGLPSPTSTLKALAAESLTTLEEAQSYANDVIALSTLPALWLGAPPQRIGESLLAVLQTTLRPTLSYIFIPAFPGTSAEPVELSYLGGEPAGAEQMDLLGRTISAWAAEHDPDDVLDLPVSPVGGRVRICAYPLGHDVRSGVLAAGFAPGRNDDPSPTRLQRTLLNIAANQAVTACRNVALQSQALAAQAETQALYEALREQDRRKDEFLSTLAHELRNPLAPIRMAVTILQSFAEDTARRQKATEILDRQTSHLVHLIDDLLDVSRISRGKISLRMQRVDIASAIQQAVDGARALSQGRDLGLSVKLPETPVYVEADPVRIAQIVGNLLNNACKYTGNSGHIQVEVDSAEGHAVVRVRDDGIGIAPDHLARIFDMFVQVEATTTRAPGGLGIGLSLARSLTQMHGGTLAAHSQGVGQGSEFVLRLPLASTTRIARAPGIERASETAPDHRLSIVAVDDYSDALEGVALLLQMHGHEVHTATSGQGALEIIENHRPDAVLLDIGLPDMDGYQVARQIRSWPWAADLLLIAMTGWGQEEDKQRAMDAGFNAHLTKPARDVDLQRLLRKTGAPRRS